MTAAASSSRGGEGGWLRPAVFLGVLFYYWVSLSPFPNLGMASLADPWAGNSNVTAQLIALGVFAVVVVTAMSHPLARGIMQPRLLLAALFGWFVVTAVISDDPSASLRRVVLAAIVVATGSIVLLLPRDERQFAKLLGIGLLAIVGLCYYGVLAMPMRAIHQASDVVEPLLAGDWRGVFSHKNVAAPAMAFTVFAGLFVSSKWSRLAGVLMVGLSLFFLYKTGGKTSLAIVPLILVLAWAFERWRAVRMPLVLGGLGLFNLVAVGSAVWAPIRNFVEGIGIDASFTDRTSIWQLAFSAIADRPLTGYGLQGFWQTRAVVYGGGSVETWAVNAANAHNAYLEAAMAGGIPGLVLVVLWVVMTPMRDYTAAEGQGNDPYLSRLFLRIWLYGVFSACLESFFFANAGPVWITILIGIFGLSYQRNAHLVVRSPAALPVGLAHA